MASYHEYPAFVEETRKMLVNRPRPLTLATIAEHVECSERWLTKIISGNYREPSPTKLQRLHDFLKNEPLEKI